MKTKVLSYSAIIEKDGSDYHGFTPSLPGVHTSGDSVKSTRTNLHRAINQHLKVMSDIMI